MIPIHVFATMIGKKSISRHAPTIDNNTAIIANTRLKYVNTFDFTISDTDIVDDSTL